MLLLTKRFRSSRFSSEFTWLLRETIAYNSIRSVQNREEYLFGPTHLQLVADDLKVVKPFTIMKRPRPGKGKSSMPKMDAGGLE